MVLFWVTFPVLLMISWAYFLRGTRRRRVDTILTYMEQAVRLNLPLPMALGVAADSESGPTRSKLRNMVILLSHGGSVAEAFGKSVSEAADWEKNTIEAGEKSGRLGRTLDRLVHRAIPVSSETTDRMGFYRIYLLFAVPAMAIVFWMYTIYVLPKFRGMFHDFHIDLPVPSQIVLAIGSDDYPAWAAGILVLIPIGWLLLRFRELFGRAHPWRWVANMNGFLAWHTPLLHGMIRDRGMTDLGEQIAEAAEAGVPLVQAVRQAIPQQVNVVMRNKLRRWCAEMEKGEPVASAARRAGMPRLMCGLLATVRGDEDLSAVMSFVARYHFSRFSRVSAFLQAAFVPVVVLLLGAMIAMVGLTIFLPLARLNGAIVPFSHGAYR